MSSSLTSRLFPRCLVTSSSSLRFLQAVQRQYRQCDWVSAQAVQVLGDRLL